MGIIAGELDPDAEFESPEFVRDPCGRMSDL